MRHGKRKKSLTQDKAKNQNISVLPTPFSFQIQNAALQQLGTKLILPQLKLGQ